MSVGFQCPSQVFGASTLQHSASVHHVWLGPHLNLSLAGSKIKLLWSLIEFCIQMYSGNFNTRLLMNCSHTAAPGKWCVGWGAGKITGQKVQNCWGDLHGLHVKKTELTSNCKSVRKTQRNNCYSCGQPEVELSYLTKQAAKKHI